MKTGRLVLSLIASVIVYNQSMADLNYTVTGKPAEQIKVKPKPKLNPNYTSLSINVGFGSGFASSLMAGIVRNHIALLVSVGGIYNRDKNKPGITNMLIYGLYKQHLFANLILLAGIDSGLMHYSKQSSHMSYGLNVGLQYRFNNAIGVQAFDQWQLVSRQRSVNSVLLGIVYQL